METSSPRFLGQRKPTGLFSPRNSNNAIVQAAPTVLHPPPVQPVQHVQRVSQPQQQTSMRPAVPIRASNMQAAGLPIRETRGVRQVQQVQPVLLQPQQQPHPTLFRRQVDLSAYPNPAMLWDNGEYFRHGGRCHAENPLEVLNKAREARVPSMNEAAKIGIGLDEDVPQVTVEFKDVVLRVQDGPDPKAKKTILHSVSGMCRPGEFLAILGPSGSGKTSLLHAMGNRQDAEMTGNIFYNGESYESMPNGAVGFVFQDEVMFSHLTVEQTMTYSALLRIPSPDYTRKQKIDRVYGVAKKLGITSCLSTKIGSPEDRGVSGGERKRAAIGAELVTNPSVIIADEPTSGLDSTCAYNLIRYLRELASAGRSVIISIHQPNSQLFAMFDKIMVLSEGRPIYYGTSDYMIDYFGKLGVQCPKQFNPADFVLEVASKDSLFEGVALTIPDDGIELPGYPEEKEEEKTGEKGDDIEMGQSGSSKHVRISRRLAYAFHQIKGQVGQYELDHHLLVTGSCGGDDLKQNDANAYRVASAGQGGKKLRTLRHSGYAVSWCDQFTILAHRAWVQTMGEALTTITYLQHLLTAVVMGVLWWQMDMDEDMLKTRTALLFFLVVYWSWLPMMEGMAIFPLDRNVVKREQNAGAYRLSAYYMAKSIVELPVNALLPTIFVIIAYAMAGLHPNVGRFFGIWFVLMVMCVASQGLGVIMAASFMSFRRALVASAVVMMTFSLAGGFMIEPDQIPGWFQPITFVGFPKWAFLAMAHIDFIDLEWDCDPVSSAFSTCTTGGAGGSSTIITGKQALDHFHLDEIDWYWSVVGSVLFAIGFRILAFVLLKWNLTRF